MSEDLRLTIESSWRGVIPYDDRGHEKQLALADEQALRAAIEIAKGTLAKMMDMNPDLGTSASARLVLDLIADLEEQAAACRTMRALSRHYGPSMLAGYPVRLQEEVKDDGAFSAVRDRIVALLAKNLDDYVLGPLA